MSQVGIVRNNAILPFTADQDMTGREGEPVSTNPDGTVRMTFAVDSEPPIGVLVKGGKAGETVSVAMAGGGLAGTVRVKLGANVAPVDIPYGLEIIEGPSGSILFGPLTGSTSAWVMAQACEPGLAGEKIEAVLFFPVTSPH